MAYTMMTKSDQTKYRRLIKKLNMDQSLKDNKSPKTVTAGTNAHAEHPFDSTYKNKNKKDKNDKNYHINSKE